MRQSRLAALVLGPALLGAAALASCRSAEAIPGADAPSGVPDATLGEHAWGASACGDCTLAGCNGAREGCAREPSCARRLDCIRACPVADGGPDPACERACPGADDESARRVSDELDRCRQRQTCAACGPRKRWHPLLNSTCKAPPIDAGEPLTPTQVICSECTNERCCDAKLAYRANPVSAELQDCIIACAGSTACEDACLAQHDSGIAALFAVLTCATIHCPSECGAPPDPCTECNVDNCADDYISCYSDHDCYLFTRCRGRCGATVGGDVATCDRACRDQYPLGASRVEPLLACSALHCGGLCR